MNITALTIENVKRIRVAEITPDGHIQVISGRNAQGKTSVLDAIDLALSGGSASKAIVRPVREGSRRARVSVTLKAREGVEGEEDLDVVREWHNGKTTLKVQRKDGTAVTAPQGVLDALAPRLTFDPLAFTRLDAKSQRETLLGLVELPFKPAELEAKRKSLYDARTEVGRIIRQKEGEFEGRGNFRADLPKTEESIAVLLEEYRAAVAHNENVSGLARKLDYARNDEDRVEREIADLKARLADAEEELVSLHADTVALEDEIAKGAKPVDAEEIKERMDTLEARNRTIRENVAVGILKKELDKLRDEKDGISDALEDLDKEKADGLAAAAFPVEGLGFDEDGVTYNGIPFSQASSAEQIRVSLAMGMAGNPGLRVLMIRDGSLLDAANLKTIADMAEAHEFQVWIERVSDESGEGIEIEDGEVVA